MRGDFHRDHPQRGEHGVRDPGEPGVLSGRFWTPSPRSKTTGRPDPAGPHVQPRQHDIERGEDGDTQVDAQRHGEGQRAERRPRRTGHRAKLLAKPISPSTAASTATAATAGAPRRSAAGPAGGMARRRGRDGGGHAAPPPGPGDGAGRCAR